MPKLVQRDPQQRLQKRIGERPIDQCSGDRSQRTEVAQRAVAEILQLPALTARERRRTVKGCNQFGGQAASCNDRRNGSRGTTARRASAPRARRAGGAGWTSTLTNVAGGKGGASAWGWFDNVQIEAIGSEG
jgi:hypothetical protein